MKLRAAACLFLLLLSEAVVAAAPARVEAVQAPAWRLRGEVSEPLAPGMELLHGDQVATGSGARAELKLAEGSTVKLGEGARMAVYSRSLKPSRAFRGALDVLQGAFRFTTAQAAKIKKRELTIRAGTATVGIRGTDLWGKPSREHDLIMLIEGRIEVQPAGEEDAVVLDDPLSVLLTFRGGEPPTLTHATADELAARAAETDLVGGQGSQRAQGRFHLRLGPVLDDEASALALYDRARTAGYPVRLRPLVTRGQKNWRYEVLLKGFSSLKEAELAAGPVGTALGLDATATR
ncbi:hypothetical protein DLREEDagrD3_10780 [Denitratisoma sp. agr-D3]